MFIPKLFSFTLFPYLLIKLLSFVLWNIACDNHTDRTVCGPQGRHEQGQTRKLLQVQIHCKPNNDQSLKLLGTYIPCRGKVKAIPVQTWRDPDRSRRLSSQISRQLAHESSKVESSRHRPSLPCRKYFWYSFLLGAESTPEPQCGRKD